MSLPSGTGVDCQPVSMCRTARYLIPPRTWGVSEAVVEKVNIGEKLALFSDHWNPRVVGELNGQYVKLVKFRGEFVWHKHDHEDELFLVVRGRFTMEFRDRTVVLGEGEFLVVPRGVEHRPVADEEVSVLLFEPATTLNTGDVRNERTVERPERI
jgi:mannose-6-phosphate isomerase-like protein (cupin superfamily)